MRSDPNPNTSVEPTPHISPAVETSPAVEISPAVEAVIGTEAQLLEMLHHDLERALDAKIDAARKELSKRVADRDAELADTLRDWEARESAAEKKLAALQAERDRAKERAVRLEADRLALQAELTASTLRREEVEEALERERLARADAEAALKIERARPPAPTATPAEPAPPIPKGSFGAQLQGWSLSELDGEPILGWGRPDPSPDYSMIAYATGGWSFYHEGLGPPEGVSARRFRPELTLPEADRWVARIGTSPDLVGWLPGVEDHDPSCIASTPWGALYADGASAQAAGLRLGASAFMFSTPLSIHHALFVPPPLIDWLAAGLTLEPWLQAHGFQATAVSSAGRLYVTDIAAPDGRGEWTPRMYDLYRTLRQNGLPVERTSSIGTGHRKYGHCLYINNWKPTP